MRKFEKFLCYLVKFLFKLYDFNQMFPVLFHKVIIAYTFLASPINVLWDLDQDFVMDTSKHQLCCS